MIDRYLLRYLLAVVDHGSFSAAARHCRVSQPTLSAGIAKLEDLLGRTLFTRSNRRVELTPAGVRFVAPARRIETEFFEAERAVLDDAPITTLRIGVISTLPTAWIERAVACARDAGNERIEIVDARPFQIPALLDRARIDAAIGLHSDGNASGRPLWTESYGLAMRSDHPLAGQDVVTAESVAGEIMFVRRDCEALADVSRYFTGRGIRPFMAGRTRSEDRSIAYIRAGLGITVMPRCLGAPSVAISELAGFSVTRAIGLLIDPLQHHLSRSTTLNCLAHALLELAREVPGIRLS